MNNQIFWVDTKSINDKELNDMYCGLPENRRTEIDKINSEKVKRDKINSAYLIYYILLTPDKREKIVKLDKNDLLGKINEVKKLGIKTPWQVSVKGKPFEKGIKLLESSPLVFVNVSHSEDFLAGIKSEKPVGIDIEIVKERDMERLKKIGKRFFHENEYKRFIEKQGKDFVNEFYKIWTGKESVIKFKGETLSILKTFYIEKDGRFILGKREGKVESVFLKENLVMSVSEFDE